MKGPEIPIAARKADRYPLEQRLEYLESLAHEMWDRGNLEYMCRPNAQLSMYRRAHEQLERFPGQAEPVVYLCHRQLGKTHVGLLLCTEEGLKHPGSSINYGTDTVDRAVEFWDEKLPNIIAQAPEWITIRRSGRHVIIRNRYWPRNVFSRVYLRGLDYRRGDRIRGGNTRMWVIDEAGFISFLEYSIRHVITPMFRGQKHPRFLILTTPPENPQDHDLYRYYLRAQKRDSLVVWPASKNPDWTADDDRLMLAEYDSKSDIAWRRELECEMIPDRERVVVPEWNDSEGRYYVEVVDHEDDKDLLEGQVMLPRYSRGYVTIDMGWKDYTGAVLSRYDFDKRRIVALDEIFVHYTQTHAFAEMLFEKIKKNYAKDELGDLIIRADADALVLADLNSYLRNFDRRLFVSEVEKWDRDAAINSLRSGVELGRVLVSHDCVNLNNQLAIAMWNARRTDLDRTKALGHCDLLIALVYQYRHIAWDENPEPREVERPSESRVVNPYVEDDDWNDSIEAVQEIFDPKGLRRNGRLR